MNGDRDIKIENGNYNERIERDYVDNKISGNIGTNTFIQNAEKVVIKIEKQSETISSQSLTSSSEIEQKPNKKDYTINESDKLKNQDYYINRPPIEENCFQEIEQDGALLRIKASEKMGKSLLLKKIFEEGSKKNYAQVKVDLQQLETASLSDYSTFLRCLCKRITRKLELESCLEDYFEGFTLNMGCSDYFEEYILENIDTPLILGIDNIDRLFASEFKIIANDFFGLLRSWHENRASNWEKLRLIVIYSTEDLPKLNIHQSPFNVGTKIELPDFEEEQILELALRYNLDWSINEAQQLREQIGGHPYLVHHAIKSLKMNSKLTLSELLEKAATDSGIYADYLQNHWSTLEQEPTLAKQLKKIVRATEPIAISPIYLYKLDSMGLITKVDNQVQPRCQIYRDYFRERLLTLHDS
ncbi:MAG: AAA-like domain-containing protein [Xenococcus sp. MO_188.B8]|nr:AAA-like domain-containing protein [Xenococcus sp. MO_188.B8]